MTPLCDRLGIEVPIIQAPIGNLCTPALAAAVANAGGLGMLTAGAYKPETMRESLSEVHALTERPVGYTLNVRRDQQPRLHSLLDAGARIVHVFWGDPAPYVAACHDAGALLLATVASAAEARRVVDAGVDVVVAQGWEAGGHVWGGVATMPLIPAVVDAVRPAPVVAAGGIGDGRGLAAALVLGAQAAWMGTRFVMAVEAATHPRYREWLHRAAGTDTHLSQLFDVGWPDAPARVVRTPTVDEWEAAQRPPSGQRPGEGEPVARLGDTELPRYGVAAPTSAMSGDVDAMAMYAGQSVGLVDDVLPAAEIIDRVMREARAALESSAGD